MTPADWQENRNQSCRLKITLTYDTFVEWELWILPGLCWWSVAATLALWFCNRIKSLGAGPSGGWLYSVTREHLESCSWFDSGKEKKGVFPKSHT